MDENFDIKHDYHPGTLEHLLISMVIDFNKALNERKFYVDNPLYKETVDPDFTATTALPVNTHQPSLSAYLTSLQTRYQHHKNFHVQILELNAIVRERAAGPEGYVYMNHEVSGAREGVIRKAVSVWRFWDKGKGWKCCKVEIVHGSDMGSD